MTNSSFDDLRIKNSTRIEQYGVPLTILWHPTITKESFFLTFNDQVSWKNIFKFNKQNKKEIILYAFLVEIQIVQHNNKNVPQNTFGTNIRKFTKKVS